ncbi:hypothetical protein [Pedobacter gandavensis]|uniref:hypothetical protein n=1 Tax=Pedobacter gandavensis TaxID=2679963 RepID=UPI00292FA6F5|nr:hypothetical protein [Pedobacter gandavensis]
MLYLNKPTVKQLADYADSMKQTLLDAVPNSGIPVAAQTFLDEKRVTSILTDTPDLLIRHHNEFMPKLIKNFNGKEYLTYLKIKSKQDKDLSLVEKTLIGRYKISGSLLKIFDYEKILSKSKSKSYNLATVLDRYTCTYCNRLYTNTVITPLEKGQRRLNDDNRITRPQFDHWFAHSVYPILGVSFYNLIPSCSVCNSSVKGDEIFDLENYTHPYMQDPAEVFSFSFNHKDIKDLNVKINVKKGSKMANHLSAFKISEVYNAHSAMELRDLLDLKYKYTDDYIHTLFNDTFDALDVSLEEIYRMVFGIEQMEQNYHKRPFSKFKHDILKELILIS